MKTTRTQRLVYKMLTTNTGRHLLDSGGAYGRNWERNMAKSIEDFMREPEESYTYDGRYIIRNVSVFHFLSQLTLDDLCDKFNKANSEDDNWNAEDVYGVSRATWEWLTCRVPVKVERTWNTYNGDSDLSQVLQGATLNIDDETYFLIQVHGGCDVRGGYTDAMLFKCSNYDGMIHEYLQEYKYNDEIMDEIREGYIDNVRDYYDKDKVWTSEQILNNQTA